jgi:glycerol-3-phosphate dehydrogenase
MNGTEDRPFDLFVVGGGINGAGIACDAVGRTLKVGLCEMNDFASATSSKATKLIHGGLRYLEYYEFRLVREALMEREVLLAKAPHISWPLRFVLPHEPHLRPRWLLRIGLFLYDHLDWHMTLPKAQSVDLSTSKFGKGLRPGFKHGFVYSDAWVDDARLVISNVKSARDMGAAIYARHRCVSARRSANGGKMWDIELEGPKGTRVTVHSRGLVNACGPWVKHFLDEQTHVKTPKRVRLVKGSHIIVPRLHDGDHAFILQNKDNRIVFVIPYEREFSLIGTTDIADDGSKSPHCTPEETAYLCELAGHYMDKPVRPADVVWTYSGVRPLFDDGDDDPSAVTRDYHLEVDAPDGTAPLLSVFGGKITTYRRLAEHALSDLRRFFPSMAEPWTAGKPLADGELPDAPSFEEAFDRFVAGAQAVKSQLPAALVRVLARRHGAALDELLENVQTVGDLGRHFGGHLYEVEARYLMREEWAVDADDVLWRRTKEGLHMTADQRAEFARWIGSQLPNN